MNLQKRREAEEKEAACEIAIWLSGFLRWGGRELGVKKLKTWMRWKCLAKAYIW